MLGNAAQRVCKVLKSKKLQTSLLALVGAIVVSGLILALSGYSPFVAYGAMFSGAFGGAANIADTLGTATPLIFTGLAVAIAMKGGAVNIGAEGQLYMGAFAAALAGAYGKDLPMVLHIALCLLAAFIAGGLWAVLAGGLKIKLGVSEVIITIMLNYIATYLTDYLTTYHFKAEGMVVKTERVAESAMLPTLYPHSRLTVGFLIAILAAVILVWVLRRTVFGYELQAVGLNSFAAESGGVKKGRQFLLTMLISGGLAGLAGACEVLGVHGYFMKGFSPGYGFDGLAIAVLGQNNPLGVTLSAILYGALRSGATMMDRMTKIPQDFVGIMQALIIIFVATPGLVYFYRRKKKKTIALHKEPETAPATTEEV